MIIYNRLIIEGNAVYEIDDECARQKQAGTQKRGQGHKEGRCQGRQRPGKGSASVS